MRPRVEEKRETRDGGRAKAMGAGAIRFRIEAGGRRSEREFAGGRVRIGRDRGNELALDDASVALWHCTIEPTADGWRLIAGQAETVLNGRAVREQLLFDGDRIDLGNVTLTFIDESASLTPDGPIVVREEGSGAIIPGEVRLAPAEAGSEAAESIPVSPASPAAGEPQRMLLCPQCGQRNPAGTTVCRACGASMEAVPRRRGRGRRGSWSLLSARATATRGVSLRQMIAWTQDGTVDESSSVSGPTTDYQWRYASETPGLSKYLGVCHRCGGPVSATDEHCAACRANLDEPVERAARRTAAVGRRPRRGLGIVAALAFLLVFAALAGYLLGFTPVGRWVLGETLQRRVQEALGEAGPPPSPGGRPEDEGRSSPDPFAAERERLKDAEALRARGNFDGALRLYTDLQRRFRNTDLAPEIQAEMDRTQAWRRAQSERSLGDQLLLAGQAAAARRRYLEVKENYADTPAAQGIDEKIAEAEAALRRAPGP